MWGLRLSGVIRRAPHAARRATFALLVVCAIVLGGSGRSARAPTVARAATGGAPVPAATGGAVVHVTYGAHTPYAVGKIVVRFIDTSRVVRVRRHPAVPRSLVTVIRYPAVGDPAQVDVPSAAPATSSGPFPLVVFGHGFDVTPAIYAQLLQAWARAGYVVAAPIFPLTNENAPGGADESDIVNQPTDMSFVITQMLAESALPQGILSQLVDPNEIAVSGQSDGGETALGAAYDPYYLDRRIDAAVILSGAKLGPGPYFPRPSPPLLATQGTADVINLPHNTYSFFRRAHQPKFLLRLLGAPHLGPYTNEEPQLDVVEQVTVAFLDRYLKHLPGARDRLWKAASVTRVARLSTRR
jgi:predicted dienelactone hydrolase